MMKSILIGAVLAVGMVPAQAQEASPEYDLEDVLRSTLGTNERLGQAEEEVVKSHLYRRQAWLAIMPTTLFNGSFIRNDTDKSIELDIPGFEMPGGEGGGFTIQPLYDYAINVSATQSVYLGGRIPKGLRLAKVNILLSEDIFDQSKRDLLLQVCVAYAQVEKAQRNLELSIESLELAKDQLKLAERLFEAGETVRTSVLRAELLKVQAERQLILAETALDKARENLSVLSGIHGKYSVKPMSRPSLPSENVEDLIRFGLNTRVELDATDKQIQMSELQQALAQGERMPTVEVGFNYTKQRAAFPSDQFWRVMLNVSMPIYDGGESTIKKARNEAERRQLELGKQLQQKEIRAEIIQAYLDYTAIRKSLESTRKELELVEMTYKDISHFYSVGEATDLERDDAFLQLNRTRRMLANLETDEVLALFRLRRSIGLMAIDIAEE